MICEFDGMCIVPKTRVPCSSVINPIATKVKLVKMDAINLDKSLC